MLYLTRKWAGVDSVREQEKLDIRKILENAAESHLSGAPPENENILFPERNRGATGVYCKWQTHKPYKAVETCVDHSPVVHLGFRSG